MTTDPRTSGQALYDCISYTGLGVGSPRFTWEEISMSAQAVWESYADLVLAHDAAARAARGEVVVSRELLDEIDEALCALGWSDLLRFIRATLDAQVTPSPDSSWVEVARP